MSNNNNDDDEIELSPGFFDLNNDEIEDIIPEKINVENNNDNEDENNNEDNNNENNNEDSNNIIIDFFTMLIFTAKSCDCQTTATGWTRTSTY